MGKKGYFWEMQTGKRPPSPVRVLLGWEVLEVNPEVGVIRAQFEAKPEFLNPTGAIQGGMLAAMLDNVLGAALAARLKPGQFVVTLELKTSYIHPAKVGALVGEGRVVNMGRTICFLEGELHAPDGNLIATATATALIVSEDHAASV